MNIQKIKSLAVWLVIGLIGSAAIGFGVSALTGNLPIGIEACNNCTFNVAGIGLSGDDSIGASGTRFPNGISADNTSPIAGEVRGTTLTSTGLATLSSSAVGGLTFGNGTFASTTVGSAGTLTEADLLDNSVIDILSNTATAFALTLPATSTMTTLLPDAGDMRQWWIQNASSTAGVAITITKGAGIDLIGVDANVDVIDGGEWSVLNCYRKVDTDVVCEVSELVHAD